MKRLLLASAPPCLLAVSLGGCYWLASYEDLTSGLGEAGAPADAPPIDGSEARPDPNPADASAYGDAGDAAAAPFCPQDAGPLAYCMDFDGVDAASLGLGVSQASTGIVSGVSVSPPSSLKVSLYGSASSGSYDVQIPLKPTTTRLEFQVLAVALGQWVTALSIALYEDATQISRVLNVVVSPTGEFQVQEYFSLPDGGSEQNGHLAGSPDGGADPGTWHHVVLTLTVDDATRQYLSGLTVDDQVIEDHQPLALSWAQGSVSLGVGVTYGGGAGPEFYFDNVRADFTAP